MVAKKFHLLVRFEVQRSENLNWTDGLVLLGFGPRFAICAGPNPWSGFQFEKFLEEPDQTGPRQHY
jgi:hypothetical protein